MNPAHPLAPIANRTLDQWEEFLTEAASKNDPHLDQWIMDAYVSGLSNARIKKATGK